MAIAIDSNMVTPGYALLNMQKLNDATIHAGDIMSAVMLLLGKLNQKLDQEDTFDSLETYKEVPAVEASDWNTNLAAELSQADQQVLEPPRARHRSLSGLISMAEVAGRRVEIAKTVLSGFASNSYSTQRDLMLGIPSSDKAYRNFLKYLIDQTGEAPASVRRQCDVWYDHIAQMLNQDGLSPNDDQNIPSNKVSYRKNKYGKHVYSITTDDLGAEMMNTILMPAASHHQTAASMKRVERAEEFARQRKATRIVAGSQHLCEADLRKLQEILAGSEDYILELHGGPRTGIREVDQGRSAGESDSFYSGETHMGAHNGHLFPENAHSSSQSSSWRPVSGLFGTLPPPAEELTGDGVTVDTVMAEDAEGTEYTAEQMQWVSEKPLAVRHHDNFMAAVIGLLQTAQQTKQVASSFGSSSKILATVDFGDIAKTLGVVGEIHEINTDLKPATRLPREATRELIELDKAQRIEDQHLRHQLALLAEDNLPDAEAYRKYSESPLAGTANDPHVRHPDKTVLVTGKSFQPTVPSTLYTGRLKQRDLRRLVCDTVLTPIIVRNQEPLAVGKQEHRTFDPALTRSPNS